MTFLKGKGFYKFTNVECNYSQEILRLYREPGQSHLYLNLEVPGLTCPGREPNPGLQWQASTLEKSHPDS